MKLPLIKTCNITPISLAIQRNSIIASAHRKCMKIPSNVPEISFFSLSSSSSFSIKKRRVYAQQKNDEKLPIKLKQLGLIVPINIVFSHAIFVSR